MVYSVGDTVRILEPKEKYPDSYTDLIGNNYVIKKISDNKDEPYPIRIFVDTIEYCFRYSEVELVRHKYINTSLNRGGNI